MANTNVNPTRMELKRLKGRLATARRGHKLLKDKRDEIMRQFLDIVRENKELREKVEANLAKVYQSFSVAAAVSSPQILEQALMVPRREGEISVDSRNIMSVNVPEFTFRLKDGASAGVNYGYAFTSGELDAATEALSELLPTLVLLAQKEKTAQMLAEEIEKTRRRVNALEYIMMPDLEEGIKSISMKLDENERGNTTRLMKVKDLMLAKTRENHVHEQ